MLFFVDKRIFISFGSKFSIIFLRIVGRFPVILVFPSSVRDAATGTSSHLGAGVFGVGNGCELKRGRGIQNANNPNANALLFAVSLCPSSGPLLQ